MSNGQQPILPEALAQRLQERSAGLNAVRTLPEPQARSAVPVLGPLAAFLRRLANRLAARWYVAPIVEQQARFNAAATAAFDELAAVAADQQQRLAQIERQLAALHPQDPPAGEHPPEPEPDPNTGAFAGCAGFEDLLRLPPEALLAWENAGLPSGLDTRHESAVQEIRDVDLSIRHPLNWKEQIVGWRYLFNMAVLGPALNCRPGDLVLDFAGGSGWVSEFLNRFGHHVVLMDYAEVVLRHSRARFAADSRLGQEAQLYPVRGDGMRLPFPDNTFDGIICMNALHHMPSYEPVLREMGRVLKPGCRAVFGEPGEIHACVPISQWTMRQQGVYEKNIHLPLLYLYAMRSGFSHMVRYPYTYPERFELPYPEVGRHPYTVLEHLRQVLPEDLRLLSLFALQKAGARPLDTNAPTWQLDQYRVHGEVTLLAHVAEVPAGSTFVDHVRVKNTGDVTWRAAPSPFGGFVRLGPKLCDAAGREIDDRLDRPALPRDIAPGEEVDLEVPIQSPTTPGTYIIKYDLVNEWRSWFELLGNQPATRTLVVTP